MFLQEIYVKETREPCLGRSSLPWRWHESPLCDFVSGQWVVLLQWNWWPFLPPWVANDAPWWVTCNVLFRSGPSRVVRRWFGWNGLGQKLLTNNFSNSSRKSNSLWNILLTQQNCSEKCELILFFLPCSPPHTSRKLMVEGKCSSLAEDVKYLAW